MNSFWENLKSVCGSFTNSGIISFIIAVFGLFSALTIFIRLYVKKPKLKESFINFMCNEENGSTEIKASAVAFVLTISFVFGFITNGLRQMTEPIDVVNGTTVSSTTCEIEGGGSGSSSNSKGKKDNIIEKFIYYIVNPDDSDGPESTTVTTTTESTTTTTTETTTESTTQDDTTTTEKESSTTTETTEPTTEPTTIKKSPDDVKHYFDKSARNALLKESTIYDIPGKGTVLSSFSNSLTAEDDKKDEKIQLDSDSLVWLNFGHTNLSDEDLDGWVIDIKNSDEEEILDFRAKANELNTTSEKVFLPKGEYTICVSSGYYYSEEEYNITVYTKNVQSCEKERNNDRSDATMLEFVPKKEIAVTYGCLDSEEDQDFYMLDMSENGHISIKFEHKELEKDTEIWDIEVLDESFTRVFEFKSKSNQVETVSSNIGLNKGRYYIKVAKSDNYSSEIYAVSVCRNFEDAWEAEPNDTDSYAKSVCEETRYYGNINETESEDYYKFTCEETGNYLIEFSQYTPEGEDEIKEKWGLKVIEGQKKTVLKNTLKISYDDPCMEERFEFNKGETYYIRISGERNNKGTDYCFIIEKAD